MLGRCFLAPCSAGQALLSRSLHLLLVVALQVCFAGKDEAT